MKFFDKVEKLHKDYGHIMGKIYAIGTSICSFAMQFTIKIMRPHHGVLTSFYYSGAMLTICLAFYARQHNIRLYVHSPQRLQVKLMLRGMVGCFNWAVTSFAATLIPLHTVGVLVATNILWGLFFDFFYVGVKLTKTLISNSIFTMIGVILVINPNLITGIFGYYTHIEESQEVQETDIRFILGVICGLSSGFLVT